MFRFRLDASGRAGARQRQQPAAALARLGDRHDRPAASCSRSPPSSPPVLASIAIWAPRAAAGQGRRAGPAPSLFMRAGLCRPCGDLLSRPKPVSLEWWLDQGRGGHRARQLDARGPGASISGCSSTAIAEPRAYRLPWDQRWPSSCSRRAREAQRERQPRLRMRLPFEPTLDDREPRFYALPQPALPPKDVLDPPAQVYRRRAPTPRREDWGADEVSPLGRARPAPAAVGQMRS